MTSALKLGLKPAEAIPDQVERLLLAGEHALAGAGDLRAGRHWFELAYVEAERREDGQGMARAALGLGGLWVNEHRAAADAAMVRIRQRDALARIDPRSSTALRLRIRMAAEDDFVTGRSATILAMPAEARRVDDPVPLAEALSLAHQCVLGPEHGALRLELARELIGVASRTGRRSDLLMGLLVHAVDLLLAADPQAERRLVELRGLLRDEDHLAVGYVLSAIEVMLAIRAGRFDQAEALATVCSERGAAAGDATAMGWYAGQIGTIRWYQGRVAELLPVLSELVNSPNLSARDNAGYAGLAMAAAAAGDRRLAVGTLARLRSRVLDDPAPTSTWVFSMCGVIEVAHLLGDAETAARARSLLDPFGRQPAILSVGVICLGSVHHFLGVASLTLGEPDRAVEHLRRAVDANLALGHWPAVARSRSRLGEALMLRDGPHDEAARRELALAAREAAELGMPPPAGPGHGSTGTAPEQGSAGGPDAAAEAGAAGTAGRSGESRRTGAAGDRSPAVVCRRRGEQWRIELGDRTVVIGNCVGMRHLAALFANPGHEIPAIELAAGPALPELPELPEPGVAGGVGESAQPVLDDVAKREYKRRLSALQSEMDELDAMNDFERAAAVRAERDWLLAELSAAAGLGGRTRRFAGSEERARIAVGKAIRRALKRIGDADPVIGDDLRAAVRTGLSCCYRPD